MAARTAEPTTVDKLRALGALLALCACHPTTTTPECSSSTMSEALAQVETALAGNTACEDGGDCVLLQTPCGIETTCAFNFSAVSVAGQAAVEHAFAVTAAEVCATCTADLTDIDEPDFNDVECPVNNPEAACNNGQCTVVAVPPPCVPDRVCEADEFCDISNVSVACPGPAYYVAVSGSGACTASDTDLGSSCQSADDCNAGESCLGANGFNEGTCGCGDAADRPTFCENGCEILSDENDCNFCYCPNGCPDGG
jgi:hypothetical protein